MTRRLVLSALAALLTLAGLAASADVPAPLAPPAAADDTTSFDLAALLEAPAMSMDIAVDQQTPLFASEADACSQCTSTGSCYSCCICAGDPPVSCADTCKKEEQIE